MNKKPALQISQLTMVMYDVHNERGFFVSEKPEAVTVILTDKPTLNIGS